MSPFPAIMLIGAYFGATLLAGGLLAAPLQALFSAVTEMPITRATSRALLLAAFLLSPLLIRASRLSARAAFGVSPPLGVLARAMLPGFALGVATFLPLPLLLVACGVRALSAGPDAALPGLASVLPAALAAGLLVAALEESLFRGAVFSAAREKSGPALAVAVSSLLYALAHFLRPASGGGVAGATHWTGGFEVIAAGFARFAEFSVIAGDFLALAAGGVALALIRQRSGHVGACIGAHAAWVAGIKLTREGSNRVPESDLAWIAGDFDGVIGYLAAAWLALLLGALLVWKRCRR